MEESIPVAVSEGTLQAPQEIMKPIQTILPGDSEKTADDTRRKRRRAKEVAHTKAKKARDLVEKLNPGQYNKDKMVEGGGR